MDRAEGTGAPAGGPVRAGAPRRSSLSARLRYRFDTALSRGPSVVVGWLGLITLAVIAAAALAIAIFRVAGVGGGTRLGFFEAFWQSLLRVLDTGTFSADTGFVPRAVGLLAGVFIAGSLIGLIANAVDQRIGELRKGRSIVLESDHTVILGWSDRVPPIIAELVIANESRKRAAVVVVADADKTHMEETLRRYVPHARTTRIVCRSGAPWVIENLRLANIAAARSAIIVGGQSDPATVKVILAIRALQHADDEHGRFRGQIVAEVESREIAASLTSLFGDQLVTVRSADVVADLTAQACRQRGLSAVFRELLDFDGDELYMAPFPALVGRTYAECQLAFEKCTVVGLLDRSYPDRAIAQLNPPADRVIAATDEVIAIAEDDSVFLVSAAPVAASVVPVEPRTQDDERRRVVIAGWSSLGPRVVAELDEFLDHHTTIELMLDPTKVDVAAVRASLAPRRVLIEVTEVTGGPEATATHAARAAFHEVIVLGYRDALSVDEADARTLLTLVAFRQVRQTQDVGAVRIVAELLDQRNARLAQASGVDDFIVSDELTSLMLAQLSERGELKQVFDDLFDRTGCSVELRPAPWYGGATATRFADIVATASTLGASAIGYRVALTGEVVINPAKSAALRLTSHDQIVVVADALA